MICSLSVPDQISERNSEIVAESLTMEAPCLSICSFEQSPKKASDSTQTITHPNIHLGIGFHALPYFNDQEPIHY